MKEVSQTTCGSWSGPGEGWMDGQHVRFMFLYDTIKARRASRKDERVEQSRQMLKRNGSLF
jgi:hypothetical protein